MALKIGFLILGLSLSFSAFSQDSIFSKVEIIPNVDQPHKFTKEFIGKGQRISILFNNETEGPEHLIDVFPDPPLTLRDNQSNTSCDITEGGIWIREHVYLSHDEQYVLVSEYSGSGEALVSYDTRTCEPFQRFDVSGLKWTIEGNQVHFQPFNMNFFVLPIH